MTPQRCEGNSICPCDDCNPEAPTAVCQDCEAEWQEPTAHPLEEAWYDKWLESQWDPDRLSMPAHCPNCKPVCPECHSCDDVVTFSLPDPGTSSGEICESGMGCHACGYKEA